MCVRTKTSYGCGHEYKTTNTCSSPRCKSIERYHYPREGDCRECKHAGEEVTRGREGKGRYAREISRREVERKPLRTVSGNTPPLTLDIGCGISPWGAPSKREKGWHSPSRQKADQAWLEEHGERNSDLQTIRDSISTTLSDHATEDREDNHQEQRRLDIRSKNIQVETRSPDDHFNYDRQVRTRTPTRSSSGRPQGYQIQTQGHGSRRHDSQESFDSLNSTGTRSSTRKYKPVPASYTTSYDYSHPQPQARDSGYASGSYSYRSKASRSSSGGGGGWGGGYETSRTEPYMYSPTPTPQLVKIKAPTTSSYGGNVYHTGFGTVSSGGGSGGGGGLGAGVEIVSRQPAMYTTTSYSHRGY
jgi:hypothetical protein